MKSQLEARNLEQQSDARGVAGKLDGQNIVVLRQASETGQLYGSVSARDIATLLTDSGFAVNRSQIVLNAPIKSIGLHVVPVALHPEVEVTIKVSVARSADEAERLARGEDITLSRQAAEEAEAAAQVAAAFFEKPEDQEQLGENQPEEEPKTERD
jgi:large subunit ribosomal protein L9